MTVHKIQCGPLNFNVPFSGTACLHRELMPGVWIRIRVCAFVRTWAASFSRATALVDRWWRIGHRHMTLCSRCAVAHQIRVNAAQTFESLCSLMSIGMRCCRRKSILRL